MIWFAFILSAFGHACWDNVLKWLVRNDPDASLLHMLWLRMSIMALFLLTMSKIKVNSEFSWLWWFKFSVIGWVIPSCMYTLSVIWTGYRVSVSFQPFIPLIVAYRIGAPFDSQRCSALIMAMIGTIFVWVGILWKQELWMIWMAILASIVHVICISEWFVMLHQIETDKLAHMVRGILLGVLIMFLSFIVWNPQHLAAAYVYKIDAWFIIVIAGGTCVACKYWVIAKFSDNMSVDAIAIFECVHPIATLCSDIMEGYTLFEWQDVASIVMYINAWILYPKKNI